MYNKMIYPIILLMLIIFHACQLPISNKDVDNEIQNDTIVINQKETQQNAATVSGITTPDLTLDELDVFDDDGPLIYFVASASEALYMEKKYIHAYGADSLAFIKTNGVLQTLKTVDWVYDIDEEDENKYRVTSVSKNEDYEIQLIQDLVSQEEAGAFWTGNITVTRRADGAVYKSDIWASSGH